MFPCFSMFLKFRDVFDWSYIKLLLFKPRSACFVYHVVTTTFVIPSCGIPPPKERKMGSPKMCEDSRCLSYGCLGPFCTIVNGCW